MNVVAPANVIGGVVAAPRQLGYWIVYLENPLGLGSAIGTVVCVGLIWSIAMSLDTSGSPVRLPGRRRRLPQHRVQEAAADARRWTKLLGPKPKPTAA